MGNSDAHLVNSRPHSPVVKAQGEPCEGPGTGHDVKGGGCCCVPTVGMIDGCGSLAFCPSAPSFTVSFLSSQSPCPTTRTGIRGPVSEGRNLGLGEGERLVRCVSQAALSAVTSSSEVSVAELSSTEVSHTGPSSARVGERARLDGTQAPSHGSVTLEVGKASAC